MKKPPPIKKAAVARRMAPPPIIDAVVEAETPAAAPQPPPAGGAQDRSTAIQALVNQLLAAMPQTDTDAVVMSAAFGTVLGAIAIASPSPPAVLMAVTAVAENAVAQHFQRVKLQEQGS